MQLQTYRRTKRLDGKIQLGVLALNILYALFARSPLDAVASCYFTVGGIQFLGWLIWLFVTPRRYWSIGRLIYSIVLGLVIVIALSFLGSDHSGMLRSSSSSSSDDAIGFLMVLLFLAPVMAAFYLALTFAESSRREPARDPPLSSPPDGL